jgi:hypothetical protein
VSEAFDALTAIVNQGVLDGVISEKAAEELFKRLDEISKNWFEGDVDEALSKIDDLHGKIEELASKGEISSREVVSALHGGLDDLAEAMGAASPPAGGEDGPGNSQGKGKGKGRDGDED